MLDQCNTMTAFFDQAASALALFDGAVTGQDLIGVNVELHGQGWPMILPWRSLDAFQGMMEMIESMSAQNGEILIMKVKCLKKREN